jgi:hypothetical protein
MPGMFRSDERVQPNNREVSSKVIEGEAIIIRLSDGIYYSMDNVGALIWGMIEDRRGIGEIVDAVIARFDVASEQARDDAHRLFDELVAERLIVAADGPPLAAGSVASEATKAAYVAPKLNVYRDMGELLALDPPAPGLMDLTWTDPPE